MRDPKRIPRILRKLGKAWTKHSDMRLMQLLQNLALVPKTPDAGFPLDPYYIEDDDLEDLLDRPGKPAKIKTRIVQESCFFFGLSSLQHEGRVGIEACIRDIQTRPLDEILKDPSVRKLPTTESGRELWVLRATDQYRIAFTVKDGELHFQDLINTATLKWFRNQGKPKAKAK